MQSPAEPTAQGVGGTSGAAAIVAGSGPASEGGARSGAQGGAGASGKTGGGSAGGAASTPDASNPRDDADSGSAGQAGSAGASSAPRYMLGADITWVQADEASGITFSDGTTRDILRLLSDHGINYIRLRSFVDARASDGYDPQRGFADLAHTSTFGARIKSAGLGFLLDLHYSDNWADPGKQCIPVAWQAMNANQMAEAVHDYTKDVIMKLMAAGARPDMVQIGNEITAGMLIHICDSSGAPLRVNSVNGSTDNWANLGSFLKAGSRAVREVDPQISIMLHIDRGGDKPSDKAGSALQTSIDWITKAQSQGVMFDVFGESCYQQYQGDPNSTANTRTTWTDTFSGLATRFPELRFVAAEYGPLQREINDVLFALPNERGLGTFNWEPTHAGSWNTGHTLFTVAGNPRSATADLALYDDMKKAYAGRL